MSKFVKMAGYEYNKKTLNEKAIVFKTKSSDASSEMQNFETKLGKFGKFLRKFRE